MLESVKSCPICKKRVYITQFPGAHFLQVVNYQSLKCPWHRVQYSEKNAIILNAGR